MPIAAVNPFHSDIYDESIREAARVLDGGGLVVFPTETVYGVGARVDVTAGLDRLKEVKNRFDRPFTIHVGRRSAIADYAGSRSTSARRLVRKAWPGPLTLVVRVDDPKAEVVAKEYGGGTLGAIYWEDSVGLRCPDHAVATDLLNACGGPIGAASANRTGEPAPRTVEDALAALEGAVDFALDGGPCQYGLPSTIVRLDGEEYELLREGVYDDRMIRSFLRMTILFVCTGNTCRSPMAGAIAAKLLAERLGCEVEQLGERNVHIMTAGVAAVEGLPATEHAVEEMRRRGCDLSGHRSRPLTRDLVQQADHVFTMTDSHRSAVLELLSSAEDRVERLLPDEDLQDPIGGDEGAYADCAGAIETALRRRMREIDV